MPRRAATKSSAPSAAPSISRLSDRADGLARFLPRSRRGASTRARLVRSAPAALRRAAAPQAGLQGLHEVDDLAWPLRRGGSERLALPLAIDERTRALPHLVL